MLVVNQRFLSKRDIYDVGDDIYARENAAGKIHVASRLGRYVP